MVRTLTSLNRGMALYASVPLNIGLESTEMCTPYESSDGRGGVASSLSKNSDSESEGAGSCSVDCWLSRKIR